MVAAFDGLPAETDPRLFVRKDIKSFDLSELSHDKAWQKAVRQTERTGEDTKISLYDMAASGGASKAMLGVVKERQMNRRALSWT